MDSHWCQFISAPGAPALPGRPDISVQSSNIVRGDLPLTWKASKTPGQGSDDESRYFRDCLCFYSQKGKEKKKINPSLDCPAVQVCRVLRTLQIVCVRFILIVYLITRWPRPMHGAGMVSETDGPAELPGDPGAAPAGRSSSTMISWLPRVRARRSV